MLRSLIAAALAALVIGTAAPQKVDATPCSSVTYVRLWSPGDPMHWGSLTITSAPSSRYVVWGEQANGGFAVISQGTVSPLGVATFFVPETGSPTDGVPQFGVSITGPYGTEGFM